jgi:hypothetical protein
MVVMAMKVKHLGEKFGQQRGQGGGSHPGSDDDKSGSEKKSAGGTGFGDEEIESPGSDDVEEPGEGNRQADRRYREATEKFVAGGGVEPAADEARRAFEDDSERRDLDFAERIGKSHSKE